MSRRIKIIPIHGESLLLLFLRLDGYCRFFCEGLPADARLVGVSLLPDRGDKVFGLWIESTSFPENDPDQPCPLHDLNFIDKGY